MTEDKVFKGQVVIYKNEESDSYGRYHSIGIVSGSMVRMNRISVTEIAKVYIVLPECPHLNSPRERLSSLLNPEDFDSISDVSRLGYFDKYATRKESLEKKILQSIRESISFEQEQLKDLDTCLAIHEDTMTKVPPVEIRG